MLGAMLDDSCFGKVQPKCGSLLPTCIDKYGVNGESHFMVLKIMHLSYSFHMYNFINMLLTNMLSDCCRNKQVL